MTATYTTVTLCELDLARPRNWRAERCEERLDALVYDVCEELALEDQACLSG